RTQVLQRIAEHGRGDHHLVVVLGVHERGAGVVGEKVFHWPPVQVDDLGVVRGTQPLLDDLAGDHVAHLDLDERPKIAGRPVLEVGDHEQLAVHLDAVSGPKFCCSHGGYPDSLPAAFPLEGRPFVPLPRLPSLQPSRTARRRWDFWEWGFLGGILRRRIAAREAKPMNFSRRDFLAATTVTAAAWRGLSGPCMAGPSARTGRLLTDDYFDWRHVKTPAGEARVAFGAGGNSLVVPGRAHNLLVDCKTPAFGAALLREIRGGPRTI